MPLPAAHILVGAGAAELVRDPDRISRGRAWLTGSALAVAPDLDIAIGVALGVGTSLHGTFTHTLLGALVVWLLARAVAGPLWGRVAGAGYLSHLLIDAIEYGRGTSIQLLWPFSGATLPSIASVFPQVPWRSGSGPEGAALSLLDPQVLPWLAAQTAVGLAFFLVALGAKRLLTRGRRAAVEG